jgi:Flp pilus assembly pilin Flp
VSLIVHTGFWTYLLITAVALVVIAVVSPALFHAILDAITQLARAIRGV